MIDAVGTNLIRFPGGTLSETHFDPANPNPGPNAHLTRITDFLDYCSETGSDAVIVLPTYKYFDPNTGDITASAEAEITAFIKNLVEHSYETNPSSGSVQIAAIEIGNEYYLTKKNADGTRENVYDWTAEEFGGLSVKIAKFVQDAIETYATSGDPSPKIFAQAGKTDEDDQAIRDEFADDMGTIDGLIFHQYSTEANDTGAGTQDRINRINDNWDVDDNELELLVSEWNVDENRNGDEDNSVNSGLERSGGLMRTFYEMARGGVDMATIWAAENAKSRAVLGRDDDGPNLLTPTGQLFRMLSENLRGTQIADTANGIRLVDGDDDLGYEMVFEGEGRTVVYFVSTSACEFTLNPDFTDLMGDNIHVHTTILGAPNGTDPDDPDIQGRLTHPTTSSLHGNDGTFDITINPFELVQIVFTDLSMSDGVTLYGDDQNNVSDTLIGSAEADVISGMGGNDRIKGEGGADTIDGGAGTDRVFFDTNRTNAVINTNADLGATTVTINGVTSVLFDVEELKFNDQLVVLGSSSTAPMVTLDDYTFGIDGWGRVGLDVVYTGVNDAVSYEIRDTSGNHSFWLEGADNEDTSDGLVFNADELSDLWVQGESSAGTQTLSIRAWDGSNWSAWDDFDVTTRATNSAPVITHDNITLDPGDWSNVGLSMSYSDADGDTAYRYEIWDNSGENSFWVQYQSYVDASGGYVLTREQLDGLWVEGAAEGGNQTLSIQVHDGISWSAWDDFVLTTTGAGNIAPIAMIDDLTLGANGVTSVGGILSYSDNDSATQYEVWDDAGGDNFILNGTAVNADTGYVLSAGDLSNLQLHGDSSGSTQTLWIRAHDGTGWSTWDSFVLTTADSQSANDDGLII
ncbi:hypothetical protein [Cochlodiniinecator piscidefendens]|uniref:hypothetical protein n=1 Tax=Cochlodiniinecator piscidefendens TaxID=2715756 RepID=UPI00140B6E18